VLPKNPKQTNPSSVPCPPPKKKEGNIEKGNYVQLRIQKPQQKKKTNPWKMLINFQISISQG
jgi:hypothetical protein